MEPSSLTVQLQPVLEPLTGVKLEKLPEQVPALRKAMAKDEESKA